MKKKLVIKFWKAEKALAMQILEQKGLPKEKNDGFVHILRRIELKEYEIYLRGEREEYDFDINSMMFKSNDDRDEYFNKITQAITDELFTSNGGLKVGEMCEVYNDTPVGLRRILYCILPRDYKYKYVAGDSGGTVSQYKYARPLTKRTKPKVEENGEVITYTWEEE